MKYKTFEKIQILTWVLLAIYSLAFAVFVIFEFLEFFEVRDVKTNALFVAPDNLFYNSIPICFLVLIFLNKYVGWLDHSQVDCLGRSQYACGCYIWMSYSDCLKFSAISKKISLINKHYVYTKVSSNPFFLEPRLRHPVFVS